jgi:hypothetical protein
MIVNPSNQGFNRKDSVLHERKFSKWIRWADHTEIPRCPGIYVIARAEEPLHHARFTWSELIIYIGMTNGLSGLKGRLTQFDNTISNRRLSHGGGDRVRLRFPNYPRLSRSLFVSVATFPCDPASNQPKDLRTMGEVARFEFLCLAEFAKRHGRLPLFNDKRASPKYSKVVGVEL